MEFRRSTNEYAGNSPVIDREEEISKKFFDELNKKALILLNIKVFCISNGSPDC
jgi:hypothetical protein